MRVEVEGKRCGGHAVAFATLCRLLRQPGGNLHRVMACDMLERQAHESDRPRQSHDPSGTSLAPRRLTRIVRLSSYHHQHLDHPASDMSTNEEEVNPYELLGISIEATEQEIKTAYRQRSLKVHPDRVSLHHHLCRSAR